jgi:hypothetical protein
MFLDRWFHIERSARFREFRVIPRIKPCGISDSRTSF